MNGREIIAALHEGRHVFSSAMISPSPLWPSLVKQAGIDFVFIDTEHIPLDRQTLAWICQAYLGLGLPSVVRLPCNDPFEACKALDAGRDTILDIRQSYEIFATVEAALESARTGQPVEVSIEGAKEHV